MLSRKLDSGMPLADPTYFAAVVSLFEGMLNRLFINTESEVISHYL